VLLGGILLVALAVRLWRLTYHSLWFDETISVLWASQPVARIWDVGIHLVEDKHPPLFQLILHGWMRLFGSGDFAVRSLGSILGALAVLPVLGIGRRLANRQAGALAALLLALNPFLVWYSQEVRMFMPAATFGLFGLYGLLQAWQAARVTTLRPGRESARPLAKDEPGGQRLRTASHAWRHGWWVLVLVGLVCATYSYLFGVFLLVVAGIWVLVLYLVAPSPNGETRSWRFLVSGAVVLALSCALVVPILLSAWQVNSVESTPGLVFDSFGSTLLRLLAAYATYVGPWSKWMATAGQAGAAVLLLIGLLAPLRPTPDSGHLRKAGRLLLGLYAGAPLLLGGLELARNRAIFDEPRYFTFVVPALCLLWGRGLAVLLQRAKWLGVIGASALLALMISGLTHLWLPQNLREDWRTAANYVQAHAGPNDAVVTHVDYMHFAFEHYFDGPQPVFFPFTDRLTEVSQVEPPLLGLLPYDTVWLVQSHTEQFDPDHLVERWLADRFPLATEQYPSGVTVKGFVTRYRLFELPSEVTHRDERLGPDITLAGCVVHDTAVNATDERSHPPSGWVHVALYWQAEGETSGDYLAVTRMVDDLGQVWGEGLQRERDTLRVWPTSRWEAGEIVRQEVDVNLNPITPQGDYRIVVRLVDSEGQPLGAEATCGQVQVVD
jgi:4-amino-4-deoxy-L-arabinose transferase-like glycosyltransferase